MAGTSYLSSIDMSQWDYSDYTTMSGAIEWTSAFLLIIVLVIVAARFTVRIFIKPPHNRLGIKSSLGSDDFLILAAVLFTVSFSTFSIVGARLGLGEHIWNIMREQGDFRSIVERTELLIKLLYCCYSSYSMAISFTKLSIIASYLRLFPGKKFRRLLYTIGAGVMLQGVISVVVIVFECEPASSSWDWDVPRRKCIDIQLFFYVSSGINVASDFALWVAPLGHFWKSKMPRKQKIELTLLYAVGLVGCLAGLFRLGQLKGLKSTDITFTGSLPLNCSMAEVSFGILCACIPPLRPALHPIMQSIRTLFGMEAPVKPIASPMPTQTNDFREYRRHRLTRVADMERDLDMDDLDRNFSQYLGSSSIRVGNSETSTIDS
ncbi:integral membrane protein [Diplocarpon rosae]|nr:integral membrane protein [Diplocarpon rosae]